MNFLEKLDFLMDRFSLNKRTLSINSDIPYTTIDNWYKRGYEGLKLPTLRKLAEYFNTTLDYWILDEITDPNYGKSSGFKVEYNEMEYIKKYRFISAHSPDGASVVDTVLNREYVLAGKLKEQDERIQKISMKASEEITPLRLWAYYGKIACAGTGFIFDDIPTDTLEAPNADADFIIRVSGDSMEPDYSDGEKLYVKKAENIKYGEVGVFTINNECFLKEYGEHGLVSRNKRYDDIPGNEDVRLIGKVVGKVRE